MQTVHLVVDSGELGQPDVAIGLEGMAKTTELLWRPYTQEVVYMEVSMVAFIFVSLRATLRVPRSLGD